MASTLEDSHFRLQKKVAQLTKVVVHLNTLNEHYEADKDELRAFHADEIKSVKQENENQLELLEKEIRHKEEAMQKLTANTMAVENAAQNRLLEVENEAKSKESDMQAKITKMQNEARENEKQFFESFSKAQNDARHRENEMRLQYEKDVCQHAESVRDLTQKLNDQSRKHQEKMVELQKSLSGEHQRRLESLKKDLSANHKREIESLKSNYDNELIRIKRTTQEQTKWTVENAIAETRNKYEIKLTKHLATHKEKCRAIYEQVTEQCKSERNAIEQELERTKQLANKLLGVKENLDFQIERERKLQNEVKRLQDSLDSMSSSHQEIVDELKSENAELRDDIKMANETLDDQAEELSSLDSENHELKSLLDTIDRSKSALQSELALLKQSYTEQDQQIREQFGEKDAKIEKLEEKFEKCNAQLEGLKIELKKAKTELMDLHKCKRVIEKFQTFLSDMRSDAKYLTTDVELINEMITSHKSALANWAERSKHTYLEKFEKLENDASDAKEEVGRLKRILEDQEAMKSDAASKVKHLEEMIITLKRTAEGVDAARKGEILSYETAMEELKSQFRQEQARLRCIANDDNDRWKCKMEQLEAELKKQVLFHDEQCHIWLEGEENLKTAFSNMENDLSSKLQTITAEKAEVYKQLSTKADECAELSEKIELMEKNAELQIETEKNKRDREIEEILQKHQNDIGSINETHSTKLRNIKEVYQGQITVLKKNVAKLEEDKENASKNHQNQLRALRQHASSTLGREATNYLRMAKEELHRIHQHVHILHEEFQSLCTGTIATKLRSMQREHAEIIENQNDQLAHVKATHSDELNALREQSAQQLATASKTTEETKDILFQTIREYETKLESQIRHMEGRQQVEVKALINDSETQRNGLTTKIALLMKDLEGLAAEDLKKADLLCIRDVELNELKIKISEMIVEHEESIKSLKARHQTERGSLMKEMLAKERDMCDKYEQEKNDLNERINVLCTKIRQAEMKWESRPSLPADEEMIKSLREQIQQLASSESQAREKMNYFKREIENREENYNRRFTGRTHSHGNRSNDSVLRVIQNNPTKRDETATSKSTRITKVSNVAGAATAKRKSSTKAKRRVSSSLPKITKT